MLCFSTMNCQKAICPYWLSLINVSLINHNVCNVGEFTISVTKPPLSNRAWPFLSALQICRPGTGTRETPKHKHKVFVASIVWESQLWSDLKVPNLQFECRCRAPD